MQDLNDKQIDAQLNLPNGTTRRWRKENNLPPNWYHQKKSHNFACYINKSQQLVFVGTAKICAEKLGYKNVGSFYRVYYRYRSTGKGRYAIFMMDLEGEDEDDE